MTCFTFLLFFNSKQHEEYEDFGFPGRPGVAAREWERFTSSTNRHEQLFSCGFSLSFSFSFSLGFIACVKGPSSALISIAFPSDDSRKQASAGSRGSPNWVDFQCDQKSCWSRGKSCQNEQKGRDFVTVPSPPSEFTNKFILNTINCPHKVQKGDYV